MEAVFSVLVGLFFATSIYLMLSPHLVRILLGVSIFGNAVNLLIFTAGRLTEAAPPVLSEGGTHLPEAPTLAAGIPPVAAAAPAALGGSPSAVAVGVTASGDLTQSAADALAAAANPLPQALILTAIVISFSIFAFLLVLTFRAYQVLETDNVDDMRSAEPGHRMPPLGY